MNKLNKLFNLLSLGKLRVGMQMVLGCFFFQGEIAFIFNSNYRRVFPQKFQGPVLLFEWRLPRSCLICLSSYLIKHLFSTHKGSSSSGFSLLSCQIFYLEGGCPLEFPEGLESLWNYRFTIRDNLPPNGFEPACNWIIWQHVKPDSRGLKLHLVEGRSVLHVELIWFPLHYKWQPE